MPDTDRITRLEGIQRAFFASGRTRPHAFRRRMLQRLRAAIVEQEAAILHTLYLDLGKSTPEGYLSEIGFTLAEIDFMVRRLKGWMRPRKVPTPAAHHPAWSYIVPEPYGRALIIAPWNYPFQLLISPLAGAMAAGNCAVVKPSEIAPNTSAAVARLVGEIFDEAYVAAVEGGVDTVKALLGRPFDKIFFTGSTRVGRIVMGAAAEHLTPVTLELGGKSPCVVDQTAPLKTTARRIAWGKFLNAGQTCIAPDYLYVHERIKPALLEGIRRAVTDFFGSDPKGSPHYGRIISRGHLERLTGLLEGGRIVMGGETDPEARYMAPTLVDGVAWEDPAMEEEIFGPILPVLTFTDPGEVIAEINRRPKPLALYVFSRDRDFHTSLITRTSSGGVCVNDTISHIVSPRLPFGGVGESGMGRYHGRYSFDAFTHEKSVMKRSLLVDPSLRYPPYAVPLKYLRRLLPWLLK